MLHSFPKYHVFSYVFVCYYIAIVLLSTIIIKNRGSGAQICFRTYVIFFVVLASLKKVH